MRLGDAVFANRISRVSLFGNDLSLPGDTTLQLRLNFSTASLLEGISAAAREDCTSDRE
jgi:hypothetical protein